MNPSSTECGGVEDRRRLSYFLLKGKFCPNFDRNVEGIDIHREFQVSRQYAAELGMNFVSTLLQEEQ